MKKLIICLFALLMVLSLNACGPNDAPAATEEPTKGGSEDAPLFDTSWASNEFEALLPKPPFSGWKTSQEDDRTYKMELTGLNTSGATNPPDSGEPDGADKQRLLSYFMTLTSYGFTVEEVGTDYKWKATDAAGNEIELMCADGGCWITIIKVK